MNDRQKKMGFNAAKELQESVCSSSTATDLCLPTDSVLIYYSVFIQSPGDAGLLV